MKAANTIILLLVVLATACTNPVTSASLTTKAAASTTRTASVVSSRHALEDRKSWELHVRRLSASEMDAPQQPPPPVDEDSIPDEEDEDDLDYTVRHKKLKKHIPFAGGDTTHGLMIDAGSQGTRLHIYEWDKRFLLDEDDLLQVSRGQKLSIPTSNSRWTDKYTPGLDVFARHHNPVKLAKALAEYLGPLLEFAKTVLQDKQDQWHTYKLFLKATGGLRTLPKSDRVRVMDAVRDLFHNDTFNPFDFGDDEQARVISGEEEAIYGWVGVNFALGKLIQDSIGSGAAQSRKLTYGMLEMGGASTQIALFENNGDLMANLFKLQLGGARHWNVYVHSYLYFGINGAWTRLNGGLYGNGKGDNVNPCLPIGRNFHFSSWVTMDKHDEFYPRSDPRSVAYSVKMASNSTDFDFDMCSKLVFALLRKETNKDWCDFEMDGSCAFAGIYQPPLPKINRDIDEFVATSNFADVYQFLQLGDRAAISQIGEAAKNVCSLNWDDLKKYNDNLKNPIEHDHDTLSQMCFRSVFVYQLLRNGWGFGDNYQMMAADVINGQKLGWALGCMLYEINTLPWNFHPELLYRGPSWWLVSLYIVLGTLAGSVAGFVLAMRYNKKFNKRVRESVMFRKSRFTRNPLVRKSLALPPLSEMDELQGLFDQADADEKKEGGAHKYT